MLDWIKSIFSESRVPQDPGEIIFFSDNDFPDSETIILWIESLEGFQGNIFRPTNYVERCERHVKSWIVSFLSTEKDILDEDFSKDLGRSYEVEVRRGKMKSSLTFTIRLRTIGVDGSTSYGVVITKYINEYGESSYICIE